MPHPTSSNLSVTGKCHYHLCGNETPNRFCSATCCRKFNALKAQRKKRGIDAQTKHEPKQRYFGERKSPYNTDQLIEMIGRRDEMARLAPEQRS